MAGAAELMEYCVAVGGALSGEHGIGLEKKQFMPLVFTEADLNAMRRTRAAFAPENRLNPGKIFPDEPGDYHPVAQPTPPPGDTGMYV